jgi:putative copper export protein/mono/diheme cytochrome c family protein
MVAPAVLRATPRTTAETVRTALARQARLSLYLALALGIAWFIAATPPVASLLDRQSWLAALLAPAGDTSFARRLALRLLLLLTTLALLRRWPTAAIVSAGLALALQPALGHAWELGGATATMVAGSEALHLLAAGAWLGGLVPLLVCVIRLPPPLAALVCERFMRLRLASVIAIAATALLQASQLVASLPALPGTAYGRLALLKLGLFAAALGLAALTRRHGVPALAGPDPEQARHRLRLSIGTEAAIGLTIVLAAGFLASLTPAVHQQPLWPFPWRLSLAAIEDPDIRTRVALALAAAGVGVASAVLALLWRRVRIALVAIGAILLAAAAPTARLLLVEAYPTSYYRSPTAFAAASIMHGEEIFSANCAVCHGDNGQGDGPLASQLKLRPADLTAAHLLGHSDGELFWWVSNGWQTSDGAQVMPSFAAVLTDADRWNVIDFVRANNAGNRERTTGAWMAPMAAPALSIICAGLAARQMADLQGNVVRVVADGDEEGVSHPPPIPPQEGYKVLILHLNRIPSTPVPQAECMAATPAAWDAYAILAGLPANRLPGAEFLIDPNGWLRAAWLPGSGRGWSTPDELIAQVRLICTHPIASDPGGDHEHHD